MPSTNLPDGLAKPAQRALTGAGITTLEQLTKKTEDEILALHGMGPKAMDLLERALAERGLSFRKASKSASAYDGAAAIDAYLGTLPADQRAALQELRKTIRSVAPNATEKINYGIPMFMLGKGLVGYNAAGTHCTLQVMSPAVLDAHRAELKGYPTGKGSVQFTPDKPIPTKLIRKLVQARIAENARPLQKPKRG